MKKLLLLICLLASAASGFATEETQTGTKLYNGLYYQWYFYYKDYNVAGATGYSSYTAKVIASQGDAYSGDITVPQILPVQEEQITHQCTVDKIAEAAFQNCTGVTSISLPNTVTTIENYAFDGCTGLTSASLNTGVKTLGDYAFRYCSNLTSIVLPSTLTSLGLLSFQGCSSLATIYDFATTPQTYTLASDENSPFYPDFYRTLYVPASAVDAYKADPVFGKMNVKAATFEYEGKYYNMTSEFTAELTSNSENPYSGDFTGIPATVTFNGMTLRVNRIGAGAFQGCTGLTSITIPSNIESIGDGAFQGCTALTSIIDERETPQSLGSNVFDGIEDLSTIALNFSSTDISKNYASADTWKDMMILPRIFDVDDITYLTTDGETAQVTTSSQTFYGLVSAYIPESVTIVGHTLSVTSIANSAFILAPSLQTVSIPKTVTSIGTNAFLMCTSLKTIYNYAATPQTITDDMGLSTPNAISLIINPEYYDAYHAADGWKSMQIANVLVEDKVTPYTSEQTIDRIDVGYRRTFNNTQWQALYIPFDMNYEDWADDYDVAAITEFTMDNDGFHLRVDKVYTNTEANNFYFIKAHNTGTQTIIAHGTTLYPAEINEDEYVPDSWFHFTFTGNYTVNTDLDERDYAMVGGKLCNNTEDKAATLYPYRWYLHLDLIIGGSVKDFNITISDGDDEEVTSIENLNTVAAQNGKHIENRRIVINKDGKKYNVAGQQIR